MNIFKWFAVILDESRVQNLDGEWDVYWARKNMREELKELKRKYRQERKIIKERWKHHG